MRERTTAPSPLETMLNGRRVLFVNAIRSDVPSGGNTSTSMMLRRWRDGGLCDLHLLELNPAAGRSRTAFALLTMPAALVVLWSRLTGWVWLEFLLRGSPWLFLHCWLTSMRLRPEVVVFNHHAAFLYMHAFRGCRRVLVWHDMPSLKRNGGTYMARDARRCAALERMAVAKADLNVTFSFDDERALRMVHHRRAVVVPVIDNTARARDVQPRLGCWLLVGNWSRAENCEGAEAFLVACAALAIGGTASQAHFHVAGHGADLFVQRLRAAQPSVTQLDLQVTSRYRDMRDFDEVALLAPLRRGAGIKLKTIEAWAAGIPVVGTAQAFTGVPSRIWRLGGHRVASVEAMAQLCTGGGCDFAQAIAALRPLNAYEAYRKAIRASAERPSPDAPSA